MPLPLNALFAAMAADDLAAVKRLQDERPDLAAARAAAPTLYRGAIMHWLYAGDTPLHLAAAARRPAHVRELLKHGSDPNAAGTHRRATPLHYAADGVVTSPDWDDARQVRTIRALLRAGADVNAADANGATPLHRAVRTRCAAAVAVLLDAGADPSRANRRGSRPFHLAVQNTGRGGTGDPNAIRAQQAIVEAFLRAGVSVRQTDGRGRTVIDIGGHGRLAPLFASPRGGPGVR
jgi:hypothetical protein